MRLHCPEKYVSASTRKIIAEKSSKAQKGKPRPKEAMAKSAESRRGQLWYNNGVIQTRASECPKGFIKGRLK